MSTILVTGAGGFIGTNFVRHWVENIRTPVVALNRRAERQQRNMSKVLTGDTQKLVTQVSCNIGDQDTIAQLLADHKITTVVNFAAESHVDRSIDGPAPFVESNVVQLQRLLEAVRRYGVDKCRFVQISTDEVYGDRMFPAKETDALATSSPYSASKAAGDHLVMAYGRTYGLQWQITRSSNNYGPFQLPEKFVPLVINKAIDGFDIPIYGDGMQSRDWIHVDDNCSAIMLVMTRGKPNEIYNIGVGRSLTNRQMTQTILGIAKSNSRMIAVADRPGHDRFYAIDVLKLRRMGWVPRTDLYEGLKATVDWYRKNVSWIAFVIDQGYTSKRAGLATIAKEPEHESNHSGRGDGQPSVPVDTVGQQTTAAGVRQTDDLLSAEHVDDGGDQGLSDHHD